MKIPYFGFIRIEIETEKRNYYFHSDFILHPLTRKWNRLQCKILGHKLKMFTNYAYPTFEVATGESEACERCDYGHIAYA